MIARRQNAEFSLTVEQTVSKTSERNLQRLKALLTPDWRSRMQYTFETIGDAEYINTRFFLLTFLALSRTSHTVLLGVFNGISDTIGRYRHSTTA